MAYNLYQSQMAKGWVERIEKETAQAEKFWTDQALKGTKGRVEVEVVTEVQYAASMAQSRISSAAPSGYTSKTAFLNDRLKKLEHELHHEQEQRRKVEEELAALRKGGSRPSTPR